MAQSAQPRTPRFTTAPAAPLEVVQTGMEVVKADLVARLTQKRSENAKLAAVRQKLAQAQLEAMRKAGVDVKALFTEAREASQKLRGQSRPLSMPPGLQSQVPEDVGGVTGLGLVTPPYAYDWTASGYIHYAPGIVSAYANRQTGALGFDQEPAVQTNQALSCYAAAAVGISFRPESSGVLTVGTVANITDTWEYSSNFAGSNTRG